MIDIDNKKSYKDWAQSPIPILSQMSIYELMIFFQKNKIFTKLILKIVII